MKTIVFLLCLFASSYAFSQTHEPIYKDTGYYGKHLYNDPEFYLKKAGSLAIAKHTTSAITIAALGLIYLKDKSNYKAIRTVTIIGSLFYLNFDLLSDINLHRAGLSVKERTHFTVKASPTSIGLSYNF